MVETRSACSCSVRSRSSCGVPASSLRSSAELAPLNVVERSVRAVTAPELPAADADAA